MIMFHAKCFNRTCASVIHFLFCLLLFWQWQLVKNVQKKKNMKNYRKEGSDETGVCPPPALTTASLSSLFPPNPYSLQCKQKLCHLHTCPAPGAAGRERVHPHSSYAIQGLLPVLILSTESGFTSLLCLFARVFLRIACGTGRPQKEKLSASIKHLVLTYHVACCSPSGHDPTWGNTWL